MCVCVVWFACMRACVCVCVCVCKLEEGCVRASVCRGKEEDSRLSRTVILSDIAYCRCLCLRRLCPSYCVLIKSVCYLCVSNYG